MANFLHSRGYKNFMSKVYGIGAAVAITGALFKITHLPYANILLTLGLVAEAVIFFFSAFEPPYIEPDWSVVYPELTYQYHGIGEEPEISAGRTIRKGNTSMLPELDEMLVKANVSPDILQNFGEGMRKMSENVARMSDISSVSISSGDFVKNISNIGQSAGELSSAYRKVSDVVSRDADSIGNFSASIHSAASSAGKLAETYNDVSNAIRKEMSASESFSNSLATASESANKLVEKYNRSADMLSQSAEALSFTSLDNKAYNEQLQKLASNLGALNTMYEVQLKQSSDYTTSNNQLKETMGKFLDSLNNSSTDMVKYQQELDTLTKRVSALNQVYGNMLTAMNVNLQR